MLTLHQAQRDLDLAGIEIGTHDNAGAREKFFVGDADGGAYLFYNNVKKLQTTEDGILITNGDDSNRFSAKSCITKRGTKK